MMRGETMIYPTKGKIEKGDEVLVDCRSTAKKVWRKVKDGPGGCVGDSIRWWPKRSVRRKNVK
jgi:hypothetical protein